MLVVDKIEILEKKILEYYKNIKNDLPKGRLLLRNYKSKVDYATNNVNDWNIEYLKCLLDRAQELNIKIG